MMKTFRPYQWDSIRDLSGHLWDGQRRVALIAPTGSGKSVIVACVLKRVSQTFKSAVIATPFVQVEESFASIKDDTWVAKSRHGAGSIGTPTTFTFEDFFFHRKDDDYWTESQSEFRLHIRSESPRFFTLITTHHAVARWGIEELPDDLAGRVLVLDEAHHAGSDEEDKESRAIARFTNEWHNRGGTVIYCTATPYRTDDLDVLPEGTELHIWSMADHAASGFAPSDFRVETENLETEIHTPLEFVGDVLSPTEGREGRAYKQMVDRWSRDGRPKAVFIVPSKNSRTWASQLEAGLKAQGARVLNAVGTHAGIKARLIQALEQERKVRRFEDSQWDVILCCKRFDEGTDWPLASHVYNYGIPRSFGLTIQRWGRAFRNKKRLADEPGIEDHTHPDAAYMVFFVPRIAEDARKHFEKFHHEYTSLLACYLARWTTAQPFGREMRNRGEGPWVRPSRPKKEGENEERDLDEIRDEQTFQVTDYEQAQADRLLIRFATKFKAQHGREPTLGEKASHIEVVRAPTRVLVAARLNLLEQLPSEAQNKYWSLILATLKRRRAKAKVSHTHPEVLTSDAELRAIFVEVIDPYRDQTMTTDGVVFAIQSRFTGQTAQEVEAELAERLLAVKPNLTEDMIVEAAKRHYARTGKWPTTQSDATEDFGFGETWNAINQALSGGMRSLPGGSSLSRLFVSRGLTSDKPPLTEDLVIDAAKRYHKRMGKWPSSSRGEATTDFGFPETWGSIQSALYVGLRGLPGGSSLSKLLHSRGLGESSHVEKPDLTEEMIIIAAKRHRERTGKWPTRSGGGDAAEDFGFPETWGSVDGALRVGCRSFPSGGPTLAEFLVSHGLAGDSRKPELNLEMISNAVKRHHKRTGKWPSVKSGDASEDFEFPETWVSVNNALVVGRRGLPGGSSLSKLLWGAAPPRPKKPDLTEDMVVQAAKRYHVRTGGWPCQRSGDASEDFGFPETWGAVCMALFNGQRGFSRKSSLFQLLKSRSLVTPKPDLTEEMVVQAAKLHFNRTGRWPSTTSKDASEDFGFPETWGAVQDALRRGLRGLAGKSSLAGCLARMKSA